MVIELIITAVFVIYSYNLQTAKNTKSIAAYVNDHISYLTDLRPLERGTRMYWMSIGALTNLVIGTLTRRRDPCGSVGNTLGSTE